MQHKLLPDQAGSVIKTVCKNANIIWDNLCFPCDDLCWLAITKYCLKFPTYQLI